jgi:hypothetical protein
MIYLVGFIQEKTFLHLCRCIEKSKLEHQIIDLDFLGQVQRAEHSFSDKFLTLHWDDSTFHLTPNDVVLQRIYYRDIGSIDQNDYLKDFIEALSVFIELAGPFAINPIFSGSQNSAKIAHLYYLSQLGFRIPKTVSGTLQRNLVRNISPNGKWISKGCSSIRTKVTIVDKE